MENNMSQIHSQNARIYKIRAYFYNLAGWFLTLSGVFLVWRDGFLTSDMAIKLGGFAMLIGIVVWELGELYYSRLKETSQ